MVKKKPELGIEPTYIGKNKDLVFEIDQELFSMSAGPIEVLDREIAKLFSRYMRGTFKGFQQARKTKYGNENNIKTETTPEFWNNFKEIMKEEYIIDIIEWPKDKIKDFHCLDQYVNWINDEIELSNVTYDYIIGHSMGGLVGIYFAKKYPEKIKNIILVESFVKTPNPFFQNLVYGGVKQGVQNEISSMLKEESILYSQSLPNQLKELDITGIIENIECNIWGIYGDRGTNNAKLVTSELGLKKSILAKVKIYTILNACHFPMLENQEEFIDIINGILDNCPM